MSIHVANKVVTPDGELVTATGVVGGGGGSGSGTETLGDGWRPEYGRYPVVDATNGPLTADSGILSGDLPASGATAPLLTQAGMTFIPWNQLSDGQPIFNYQGMVPAPAPANIQASAGRSCLLNANTPRWYFGNTGQYYNGNQSIRVGIAATRVVPVWYVGQGQISAATVDMHVMVEHNGENKHLSSSNSTVDGLPRTTSGGSGTYRRELTYKDHRYREHRFLLGANGYFLGVWVDTISVVRRPANRPQLFVHGVDSWQDPQTWSSSQGYGWPSGDYQCLPQCVVASFRTGMAHGTDSQGGTGELNANGTSGGNVATYNGNRSSMSGSDSRVNWRRDHWSSQFGIELDIGGWNDGTAIGGLGTPYRDNYRAVIQARIQKTISRFAAIGRETRFIIVGIQPADISGPTDVKYLAALGQSDIPALFPGVVLGHVSLMPMWPDTSTSGPRNLYTWTSDRIHLNAAGDDAVVGYYLDGIAKMKVDRDYLNKTATADVPLQSVPTS